jgi:carbamoyltransferase
MNTSFNLKGEPIVNSPANALNTFKKSGLDILALENYIIRKEDIK